MSMYAEDALLNAERLRSQRLLAIPREFVESEDFCESVIDNESYIEASEWEYDGDMSSKWEQSNSKVGGDEDCASGVCRIEIWVMGAWKFILASNVE